MDITPQFIDYLLADPAIREFTAARITSGALAADATLPAIRVNDISAAPDPSQTYLQVDGWIDGTEPAKVLARAKEFSAAIRARLEAFTGADFAESISVYRDQILGQHGASGPQYDRRRCSFDLRVEFPSTEAK